MEAGDVAAAIVAHARGANLLVVTGGEPMLQQRQLMPLLEPMANDGWKIEVETAGTRPLVDGFAGCVDRFNVSPKLENSGNLRERCYRPDVLAALLATEQAVFKFVVRAPDELYEVDRIVEAVGIPPTAVWVMPEGTTAADVEQHTAALWDDTIRRGWNITTRLHVLAWGKLRGV
jgi:7-carboxy-7-deazaguanine synthase